MPESSEICRGSGWRAKTPLTKFIMAAKWGTFQISNAVWFRLDKLRILIELTRLISANGGRRWMLRYRLVSMKIISCDILRLNIMLFFLDHSTTFVGSSDLVSTFYERDDEISIVGVICTASFLVRQALYCWSWRHNSLGLCQSPELFLPIHVFLEGLTMTYRILCNIDGHWSKILTSYKLRLA